MKELLIAELKRALELFEKVEEGKRHYEIEKAALELKKEADPDKWHGYVYDKSHKQQVELRQILKMIRSHSVTYEKENKRVY